MLTLHAPPPPRAATADPSLAAAPSEAPTSAATKQGYRDAMARLGAAVHIVTTEGPGGRAGFTASAVCSVTDEPPTLLVCLNRAASAYPCVDVNGVLCVNTLTGAHQALSALFGGKTPMADRFAAAAWDALVTGAPVLRGAAAAFDCRIASRTTVGTHDVLICEVLALRRAEAVQGLVYFDRRYHPLG